MAVIPLTLYGLQSTSSVLGSAGLLTTTSGGATTTPVATTIGTSTGFFELNAHAPVLTHTTGSGLIGLYGLDNPSGHGWLFDSPLLDNSTLVGGAWSNNIMAACSAGVTLTADLYVRFFAFPAATPGAFVSIGAPMLLAGQTITATPTIYGIGGILPQIYVAIGTRLYIDAFANITNATGLVGSGTQIFLYSSSTGQGVNGAQFISAGYQSASLSQVLTAYTFGGVNYPGFCFNDGVSYFLQEKTIEMVQRNQTTFKIGRFDGKKKTGETIDERRIGLRIKVVGTSRSDLELKLDALMAAFTQEQQKLLIHAVDMRYFIADCIKLTAPLPPGTVLAAQVSAEFVAQQPFAYAWQTSSYSTGTQQYSNLAGAWTSPTTTLAGGGTWTALPTITITNNTPTNGTGLTTGLTSGNNYTTLAINALPQTVGSGATLVLSSGGHTQTVTLSSTAAAGSTSIAVTSFAANFSYPAGTTVTPNTQLNQVSVINTTNGQTLTVPGLTMNNGDVLTIVCDPQAANGFTCTVNGGNPLNFTGIFPVQDFTADVWQVTVNLSTTQPTVTTTWTWTARYSA